MKLPTLVYPEYTVQLFSHPKPIKYRPFTVAEEKLMLMAASAEELETTIQTLKQIVSQCVINPDFDVEKMAMIDMEIMFLQLRARSIGPQAKTYFKCLNEVEDKDKLVPGTMMPCGMVLEANIDLLNVPIINTDVERMIMLTDEIGVKMKYPSFSMMSELVGVKPENVEQHIVASCIDLIFDKEQVFKASDCSKEELLEFLNKLPSDKYEKLKAFSQSTPTTHLEIKTDCTKCGYKHNLVLEGLQDFFV